MDCHFANSANDCGSVLVTKQTLGGLAVPAHREHSLGSKAHAVGWITFEQATFYGAVWGVAFVASIFVHLGNTHPKPIRNCFWASGVAGFLAFATVALFLGNASEPVTGHLYYLGLSALVGLSSKQAEQLRKKLWDFILAQKITFKTDNGQNEE